MATRGWNDVTADQIQHRATSQAVKAAKPSKFKNVKFAVDGRVFDSKREGRYYLELKARQAAGEIEDLKCQVAFPLLCPTEGSALSAMVAFYLADFTYIDRASGKRVIVDAKGARTQMYVLKRKWLFLQDGIEIQEV